MSKPSNETPAPETHLVGSEVEQLRDRAETAVVAANALQARVDVAEAALREQVDACDAYDCEMCHRHRGLLASKESPNHG